MSVKHLAIIGVGLIGGSVARALRHADYVGKITGIGRHQDSLERAMQLGVVDVWTMDIAEGVHDADVVLVSVPMGGYAQVLSELAESLPVDCLLTDAGSTKQHAVVLAGQHLSAEQMARFVPAHPIAGTEASGVEASFSELFQQRLCVLTPSDETDQHALDAVHQFWQATGSDVSYMKAEEHDDFLAAVSHLPHLAAFALVNAVRKMGDEQHDPFQFAAGGFRDFTRIASSSPEMWRDIALSNKAALLTNLDAITDELSTLRTALKSDDGDALLREFSAAKQARDTWLAEYGDVQ